MPAMLSPAFATAIVPTTPAAELPKRRRKRLSLFLEPSTCAGKRYGQSVLSQILYLRLEGITITQISEAVGCSDDLITDLINLWQTQIAVLEGEGFTPLRLNGRRSGPRRRRAPGAAIRARALSA